VRCLANAVPGGAPVPCARKHVARSLSAHDEEDTTTIEAITEAAVPAAILALVSAESCADAGPVRLDHAHRARQRRSGSDQGLVRQGSGLDVQAELSDARRRRVSPVCVLRPGRRRDSQDQSVRGAGQQLLCARRGRARRLRKGFARRSRGNAPAYAGDARRDHRRRTRTRRSSRRLRGPVVKASARGGPARARPLRDRRS